MYKTDIVNEFIEAMSVSLEKRSSKPATDVWPSPYADITLANDINGTFILSILDEIYASTDNIEQIAKLFYRPSRIVYLMYLFSIAPRNTEESNKRILLAEKMLNSISILRCGDPFIKKRNNIILGASEILDSITLYPVKEYRSTINRIIACLSAINEYCFFAWMGMGREVHGIYEHNGRYFVIRDFYDLCADYWQFTSLLPWKSICIVTEETEDSHLVFDFNGRMYRENSDNSSVSGFAIIIDDYQIEVSETSLNNLLNKLMTVIHEARIEATKLKGNELLLQYAKMQLYSLKDVAVKLGVAIPTDLPENIQSQILSASGASTFSRAIGLLKNTSTREERITILKGFFDPGNINKAGV